MYRQHQRRRHTGQDQADALKTLPMLGTAIPAVGEYAVDGLGPLVIDAVSDGGQVRHQADEPEHERHGEVGADGEHVP